MRHAQVFLSYRRDDTAGYARALGDELAQQLGADRVFMDVDDIQPGQPFAQVIEHHVGAATVLLVLIGKRWLGEREGMPSRIDDPIDFVRREVAAGLASGARVIPVLLDGAAMPTESQLPHELRALAGRNALAVDHSRYAADLSRLLAAVRVALGEPPATASRPQAAAASGLSWGLWWFGAAVAVVAGIVWWQMGMPVAAPQADREASPKNPTVAQEVAARPDINGLWQADVRYDWPNADYVERFEFRGEGNELHGSASFLRVPRRVIDAQVDADGVRFVTLTTETTGSGSADIAHRYEGRFIGNATASDIRFVMQTEGGSSVHVPVEFVARRTTASASTVSASASR